MRIQEAVAALIAGKHVARHVWRQGVRLVPKGSNPGVWQYMDGVNQRWSPSIEDLNADDWCVVESEPTATDHSDGDR